jgi:hypothetical protein
MAPNSTCDVTMVKRASNAKPARREPDQQKNVREALADELRTATTLDRRSSVTSEN